MLGLDRPLAGVRPSGFLGPTFSIWSGKASGAGLYPPVPPALGGQCQPGWCPLSSQPAPILSSRRHI